MTVPTCLALWLGSLQTRIECQEKRVHKTFWHPKCMKESFLVPRRAIKIMHECICHILHTRTSAPIHIAAQIKTLPSTGPKKKWVKEETNAASHFYGSIHVTTEVSSGCWQLVVDNQLSSCASFSSTSPSPSSSSLLCIENAVIVTSCLQCPPRRLHAHTHTHLTLPHTHTHVSTCAKLHSGLRLALGRLCVGVCR